MFMCYSLYNSVAMIETLTLLHLEVVHIQYERLYCTESLNDFLNIKNLITDRFTLYECCSTLTVSISRTCFTLNFVL